MSADDGISDQEVFDEIVADAEREVQQEQRRKAIDAAKERIIARAARPWWARIFPWRVTITRRG